MRLLHFLCGLSLCLPAAALAQTVTVTGLVPAKNSFNQSNVLIAAKATSSAAPISGWAVYLDNNEYYHIACGSNGVSCPLNGTLNQVISSVPAGNYKVTVTAFDENGNPGSYVATNVTVSNSVLPNVPSTAELYPNLQNTTITPTPYTNNSTVAWQVCQGPGCAGGDAGGTGNVVPSDTPSSPNETLSGSPLFEYSTGAGYNVLGYRHLGCVNNNNSADCNNVQNMLLDMWFSPVSTANVQQIEFDPDLFDDSGHKYAASVACRLQPGNSAPNQAPYYWYVWNSTGIAPTQSNPSGDPTSSAGTGTWVMTAYPCSDTSTTAGQSVAAGVWHHIQLYVNYDTTKTNYTYNTFVYDGVTIFQSAGTTYQALQLSGPQTAEINVEQQIDNTSGATTNSAYYDDYNLSVW